MEVWYERISGTSSSIAEEHPLPEASAAAAESHSSLKYSKELMGTTDADGPSMSSPIAQEHQIGKTTLAAKCNPMMEVLTEERVDRVSMPMQGVKHALQTSAELPDAHAVAVSQGLQSQGVQAVGSVVHIGAVQENISGTSIAHGDHQAMLEDEVVMDDNKDTTQDDMPEAEAPLETCNFLDGEFNFCLLIAPCPDAVKALVLLGDGTKTVMDLYKAKLPDGSKQFMPSYSLWRFCIPSLHSTSEISITATFSKLGVLKRFISYLPGNMAKTKKKTMTKRYRPHARWLQVEVLHIDLPADDMQLAIATVLVLLSTPTTMSDCFQNYFHHASNIRKGYHTAKSIQRDTSQWLGWIQQTVMRNFNTDQETKVALAVIYQFHVLHHLQQEHNFRDFIVVHYETLLYHFPQACSLLDSASLPRKAVVQLQQAACDIVSFTPAQQWSSYLDALCKADSSYWFLDRWAQSSQYSGILRTMDKEESEKNYNYGVSNLLSFASQFSDASFTPRAIKAAILAAPTGQSFCKSMRDLYCSHVLPQAATDEDVEASLTTDYGRSLIHKFGELTKTETPLVMGGLLLKELKISGSRMNRVLRILIIDLLRCQIFTCPVKDSNSSAWQIMIHILTCTHTFTAPLLSGETTFLYGLVHAGHLDLAAHAILKVVKQVEVLREDHKVVRFPVELFRTWLQRECARAANNMTPYGLYNKVIQLFGRGLQSARFLSDTIWEVVRRALEQQCDARTIIQDAGKMSHFDCEVLSCRYHAFAKDILYKYLEADSAEPGDDKPLDWKAEELLQWLCTKSSNHIILNGWIQEELCVALMDALSNLNTDITMSTVKLIESRFMILILQVENVTQRVQEHVYYASATAAWADFHEQLKECSISVEMLAKVMICPTATLEKVCKVQRSDNLALKDALRAVSDYKDTRLKGFWMLLDCAVFLGLNEAALEEAQSWLETRSKEYKHFTLREITEPDHWPIEFTVPFLESMLILERSIVLKNTMRAETIQAPTDEIKDSPQTMWTRVATIIRKSLQSYQEEWQRLSALFYPVENLGMLLDGVSQSEIEREVNLAQKFLSVLDQNAQWEFQRTLMALRAWLNLQVKASLIQPLVIVKSLFNIGEDNMNFSFKISNLCSSCSSATLSDFLELYNQNIEVIDYFSTTEGLILKQLAESDQLISFLKENSDVDLRVLTDAIEEQAEDALVDEATVSDLIQLEKVLRPLLKISNLPLADLKVALEVEIEGSDAAAAQFTAKLSYCNKNIQRIRQFVASLADRSSVLRENMHQIMQSGVVTLAITSQFDEYRFDVCTFSLTTKGLLTDTSKQNSRNHFSLSDLKDLRSRAKMLLGRRRMTHDLSIILTEERVPSGSSSDTIQALGEFVEHVNAAEKLFEQLCTIHSSGHLSFGRFNWCGCGLKCLHGKAEWMHCQIANWDAALERARAQYKCLNFFKGIELRLIYQCFGSKESSAQMHLCYELLEWAQPGLEKASVATFLSHKVREASRIPGAEMSEAQLFDCLQSLARAIGSIFENGQLRALGRRAPLISPPPTWHNQDSVLLVSVEDQHHGLNMVVRIFQTNGGQLRINGNNLLLCNSRTTWEEIHLLLLRYSDGRDADSQVLVIAFIERLNLDCQLQLMAKLQENLLYQQQPMKHRLALVCCTESQCLQGISHYLKVPIQFINWFANESIHEHLPQECGQMEVVTSELSGMGKSMYIRSQGPSITLTITGKVSQESLILRLKEMGITSHHVLHIDITAEEDLENLNALLFELLICGALKSSHVGLFKLETSKVCIELANTLGNHLEASLSVCSWLPRKHLSWELDSLHVSDDLESDEQVVCVYLDALQTCRLDRMNIITSGRDRNVSPLPVWRCRELLNLYFISRSSQMSFCVLRGFIRMLAYQLRKFGEADFYSVETISWILRASDPGNFRSTLVASLVEAARELSLRSVKPWLHEEQLQVVMKQDMSTSMHNRMVTLLRWSESNHVMIFFDVDWAITVLYRELRLVPESIKTILSIQVQVMGAQLRDYSALSSQELWEILWPIVCKDKPRFLPQYALTPDNFLKMALISLRIKTHVPVIIMGETGCGKTSLLKALATISNTIFSSLTLHAGSSIQDIESFLIDAEARAISENTEVWAFLDEINACHHLGFLNGILCHNTINGRSLSQNLVVLAACNPYRLQDPESKTVGLQSRNFSGWNKQELAYKVQPLPEAMLDYVWDYGILSESDEGTYIKAMISERSVDIVDLLSISQNFMRTHLGVASVSLRDIERWISLYDWFLDDVKKRHKKLRPKEVQQRAKILACSLCYHCRLPEKELRRCYREICCKWLFDTSEIHPFKLGRVYETKYLAILEEEERDILKRMEIPPGIAINSSLLENVFVVLICLLNYIPVFVVGKPGSGKTLALQIIYSNLRGTDSKDEYFQNLPRILLLSYQGSQNSTSEGILKVFNKAKRYVESNRERDVLVVVVLDEVGLAETSSHNPLKVLHPLLEPDEREIAVVGISNWSLDAAKMNRGIHLMQSDPEVEDLYKTSLAIFESYKGNKGNLLREKLYGLATAYYQYHAQQATADFHGLRDFYSLIKSLRFCSTQFFEDELLHALWRNFGGRCLEDMQSLLSKVGVLTNCNCLRHQPPPPVIELIKSNLDDSEARHLLLITKGDSASSILQHMLQQEEVAVIRGSTYKDDMNEEYCYLMLSDIILHMEMGRCILLENADQIWSSLYDMLNQHYTVVGGRRNCRIALGVYSNPMCFVHDSFRCIVIVDINQIPSMDPPFLNRFEKQILTYERILDDSQHRAVEIITTWVHELASKSHYSENYRKTEEQQECKLFAGYYEDSVPSLVMLRWKRTSESDDSISEAHILQKCKIDLLQTAYVDAIARAHLLGNSDPEVNYWTASFLSMHAIQCLEDCLKEHIANIENWTDNIGLKLIVTTCSPLQWSIQKDMERITAELDMKAHCMRLGDFTSEKQLQGHIQKFWSENQLDILVLQAGDVEDQDHISLAKFHIDKARRSMNCQGGTVGKHVVLILHVQQGTARKSTFSFLCGWKQLTIHRLQRELIDIRVFLEQPVARILEHENMPLRCIMTRVLTWSYLCIQYHDEKIPVSYPQEMVQSICKDESLLACLKQRALLSVLSKIDNLWQLAVLNNQKLLSTSASVHDAFVHFLEERFREAVARLVYLLERTSSIKSYFSYDAERQHTWRQLVVRPDVLDCDMAPAPCYPEGYKVQRPLELELPFSSLYAAHINRTFKQPYLETIPPKRSLGKRIHNGAIAKPSDMHIHREVDVSLSPALAIISTHIHVDLDAYIVDFSRIYTTEVFGDNNAGHCLAFEWVLRESLQTGISHPSDLHTLCWNQEEELKVQVLLVSLCFSSAKILEEIDALKAGRSPNRSFKEDLALRCCSSLMPTETLIQEVGGLGAWIRKAKALLSHLSPFGSAGALFMLQTLYDLALFVILPLQMNPDKLNSLSTWFQEEPIEAGLPRIIKKVVRSFPRVGKLGDQQERKCWVDFLCSVLKKYPEVESLPKEDLGEILRIMMTSPSPSCMIGPVMFKLLSCCCLSQAKATPKDRTVFLDLLSNTEEVLLVEEWDEEVSTLCGIALCDQVYHNLRDTIKPILLGTQHAEDWDGAAFDECFCMALQFCEGGTAFSPRKIVVLAFVKSVLYSAASLLYQAYTEVVKHNGKHQFRLICLPTFVCIFSTISPILRQAIQVFFMKVLHWDFGQSAGDIADLLAFCDTGMRLPGFSCLLDHQLVKNVWNRLGFNPFICSSIAYHSAELALKKLVLGETSEVKLFLQNADQEEQTAFMAAIASNFFVIKSGRKPSNEELCAITWLDDALTELSNWDALLQQSVRHVLTDELGGIWHQCVDLSTNDLQFRCLALDILVRVAALPAGSPLRGYSMLDPLHFDGAHVLSMPDSFLQGVAGIGSFAEYACECGYGYIIGDCTRPNEVGTCPRCKRNIGGTSHTLIHGNTVVRTNVEKFLGGSVAAKDTFTIRLQPKSYRLLRVLVNHCLLIGVTIVRDRTAQLANFLELPHDWCRIVQALTESIEVDMLILDNLLACPREKTYQYIHGILQFLPQFACQGPLQTVSDRDQWELAFEKLIESLPINRVVSEYLSSKGTDGLNNLLQERSPCPPTALQDYLRITRVPSLLHYGTMFLQEKSKTSQYPCITAVLVHTANLCSLSCLLPIVEFSASLHELLSHKITRHAAATTTIQEILRGESHDMKRRYDKFEACWNSTRHDVEGYECRQFHEPVPEMHMEQPVALCLLERKDQGIYLTAILELLRTHQNTFLEDVAKGFLESGSTKLKLCDAMELECMPSERVQFCKAEHIINFEEAWADTLVSELGMCSPAYGNGTQVQYDEYHIELEMYDKLVQGKAKLEGKYVEFPFQQESFQRHATLVSDVVELVAQQPMPLEKLNNIRRELGAEGLGDWQLLTILELCLGSLRRTNAEPGELLRQYCNRWLGGEAQPILSRAMFDEVRVEHVVSLYEGLEEAGSAAVEDLVMARYRQDLDAELTADLEKCVMVKKKPGWGRGIGGEPSSSREKLGAEAFRDVLRRFMFRYLTADTFNANDELVLYLTDSRLVQWPAEDVEAQVLQEIFPCSFRLAHARAIYMALKGMCS